MNQFQRQFLDRIVVHLHLVFDLPPVLGPLPHIAHHVEQPVFVGLVRIDRRRT